MGDGEKAPLRLQFNPKVRLEFHGSTITSDAGLLAFRELDDALDLTGIASNYLQESRTGRNILHHLVPLLRQSIYSRLAGYDDTNDAVRLSKDPAMRVVVACSGSDHNAASTSEMGRFETETLTEEKNLKGLAQMNSQWVEGAMVHTPHRRVILDMDSSESPVHGQQEGAAYNGHFECVCYHPLFLFNQFGDCEAATLRPGNVHSADDWQELLEPVVKGYRKKGLRLLFRGDAAFGKPEVYEYLEQETIGYTIRLSLRPASLNFHKLASNPVHGQQEGAAYNAVLQREIASTVPSLSWYGLLSPGLPFEKKKHPIWRDLISNGDQGERDEVQDVLESYVPGRSPADVGRSAGGRSELPSWAGTATRVAEPSGATAMATTRPGS